MIQHCRICGIVAGGLVTAEQRNIAGVQFGWPELDICPMCVNGPDTEDETLLAIFEQAKRETEKIRKAERAGERIDSETMGMLLT